MEDAATAEISRSQIWQWLAHGASVQMDGGFTETLTRRLYDRLLSEELKILAAELSPDAFVQGRFDEAAQLFTETATAQILPDFLTIPAYDILETK
jgi:malate synthase